MDPLKQVPSQLYVRVVHIEFEGFEAMKKLRSFRSKSLKDSVDATLRSFGIGIARYATLEKLRSDARVQASASRDIAFLRTIRQPETLHKALQCLPSSKAQLRQDLFVLAHLGFKTDGFFVEFGATNGIELSNTYLLEKEFNWTGILAEPARCWHELLRKNRNASIETRCVWRDSNSSLLFNEVQFAEYSTVSTYTGTDLHVELRRNGREYPVETISLLDLLDKYNAPEIIDYLSIDTEGSEFEILEAFDFSKYKFRVITCEHNYTPMRQKIFELLSARGYSRVLQDISYFDDWYVLDDK